MFSKSNLTVPLKDTPRFLPEKAVEEGMTAAGSTNKYQYYCIFLLFFVKVVADSFYNILPFVLVEPETLCQDEVSGEFTLKCSAKEACERGTFIYSGPTTFISQFNLLCEPYQTGLIGSTASLGGLVGNLIVPSLVDNLGRVKTASVFLLLSVVAKILMLYVTEYYWMLFLMTANVIINNVSYNSICLYLNEMIGCSKRGLFFCMFNCMFGLTGVVFTLIFNFTQNWQSLFIFAIVSSAIGLLVTSLFLEESIRFLYLNKEYGKIIESLRRIAKFNKRTPKLQEWESNLGQHQEDSPPTETSVNKSTFSLIYTNREVLHTFLLLCAVSMVFMSGITYNAIDIRNTGDKLVYPIIFFLTDFTIILTAGHLIEVPWLGRRIPAIISAVLACVGYACKFFITVSEGDNASAIWADYITRFSVGINFNILIQYGFEVYSTDIRAVASSVNMFCARCFDLFVPVALAANRSLTTLGMVGLYAVLFLIVCFLKETRGQRLKESCQTN